MFSKKNENSTDSIKWSQSGESFIIYDIEKFVKILPLYFKTKNYSSFVRQLNMYNFHKVKNQNNYIEFRHETLKKNSRPNLENLSRRISNDKNPSEKVEKEKDKSYVLELNRLKRSTKELDESINTLLFQTDSLTQLNKELIFKIYDSKKNTDSHARKLLVIYFALVTNSEPEILVAFRKNYHPNSPLSSSAEEQKSTLENIEAFIKNASKKILFSNDLNGLGMETLLKSLPALKDSDFKEGKFGDVQLNRLNVEQALKTIQLGGDENMREGVGDFSELDLFSGVENKSHLADDSFVKLPQDGYAHYFFDSMSKNQSGNNYENSVFQEDSNSDALGENQ